MRNVAIQANQIVHLRSIIIGIIVITSRGASRRRSRPYACASPGPGPSASSGLGTAAAAAAAARAFAAGHARVRVLLGVRGRHIVTERVGAQRQPRGVRNLRPLELNNVPASQHIAIMSVDTASSRRRAKQFAPNGGLLGLICNTSNNRKMRTSHSYCCL